MQIVSIGGNLHQNVKSYFSKFSLLWSISFAIAWLDLNMENDQFVICWISLEGDKG